MTYLWYIYSMQLTHCCLGSLLLTWITLIPAWLSKCTNNKVWDEITYPFPNLNGTAVEVSEWISNTILHPMGMWLLIHDGINVNPCK